MLTRAERSAIRKRTLAEDNRMPVIFDALGDPGRFGIFKLLTAYHDICVTDVAAILGITVPAASQQLKVLERVGLVRKERTGQMICYEVRDDDPVVRSLCKFFS